VEQQENFLRQVLGRFPLHTGCREAENPFAQAGQDLVTLHGVVFIIDGWFGVRGTLFVAAGPH
jgi:hypothetical protein